MSDLTFDAYQTGAMMTAQYPGIGDNPFYPAMGLAGEAGEVCNKVKKIMRDGTPISACKEAVRDELGDCMWYIAVSAKEFGLSLEDIARHNLRKLEDRARRDVISGSGDNR